LEIWNQRMAEEAMVAANHSERGQSFVLLARNSVKMALRGVPPVASWIVWMEVFRGSLMLSMD